MPCALVESETLRPGQGHSLGLSFFKGNQGSCEEAPSWIAGGMARAVKRCPPPRDQKPRFQDGVSGEGVQNAPRWGTSCDAFDIYISLKSAWSVIKR